MRYDWVANNMIGITNENAMETIKVAALDMKEERFYLIMYSDAPIKSGKWEDKLLDEIRYKGLLDLRIFNKSMEIHVWRSNLSDCFNMRKADDNVFKANIKSKFDELPIEFSNRIYDEKQFLDIDMATSQKLGRDTDGTYVVKTMGGGKYTLPVEKLSENLCVHIRNYIDFYEETGQAVCADWRIVAYEEGGKK